MLTSSCPISLVCRRCFSTVHIPRWLKRQITVWVNKPPRKTVQDHAQLLRGFCLSSGRQRKATFRVRPFFSSHAVTRVYRLVLVSYFASFLVQQQVRTSIAAFTFAGNFGKRPRAPPSDPLRRHSWRGGIDHPSKTLGTTWRLRDMTVEVPDVIAGARYQGGRRCVQHTTRDFAGRP